MPGLFHQPGPDDEQEHGAPARYALVAVERGIERGMGVRAEQGRGLPGGSRAAGRESAERSDRKRSPGQAADAPDADAPPDGTLTYRIPSEDTPASGARVEGEVAVGDRVQVPLAKHSVEGIVVRIGGAELLRGLSSAKVKSIVKRTGATLPAPLIELGLWISQYYVCPLGMVLGAMMPAAVKRGAGARTVLLVQQPRAWNADAESELSPAARRAWEKIRSLGAGIFPLTPKALAAELDRVSLRTVNAIIASGLLNVEKRSEIDARGWAPSAGREEDDAESGLGESHSALDDLARPADAVTLTGAQQEAIAGITGTSGRFAVHLVHGVTGSGKTEVYLRAIEACLKQGRRAVVLVPEISLTPQTSRRFVERFGSERVAVLHSGLSSSQRNAQWAACAAGLVSVVVGARSAVFAPLTEIGLIVVDEEHDSSYKQDQLPRYHARDVAVKRGHLLDCPVVLGSATPSLESYANASDDAAPARAAAGGAGRGSAEGRAGGGGAPKYQLWSLPARVGGATMPRVEIVDLVEERRVRSARDGSRGGGGGSGWRDRHLHLVGPRLEAALERTLDAGGQAILLLNKRGYANYIFCPDPHCGWVMQCDHCDATMVLHLHEGATGRELGKAGGFVRCHHCLTEQMLPRTCPRCRRNLNTFGLGTQRVEEELERKFAVTAGLRSGTTMLRLDGDSMRSARDYFGALERFARGEVKVLLGTQMIAKGLDFPNVQLVGVINADTALALPDFRAAERTFQLVSQVVGRTGRPGSQGVGLAIVQTYSPKAPSIRLAATHDYATFAREELATRRRAGVPPATRMVRIVCRDEDYAEAAAGAERVHAALQEVIAELGDRAGRTRLRPPAPCPVSRVANHYRFGVELMAQSRGVIQTVLGTVRSRGLLKSDAHTAVDVDPVALL